MRPTEVPDQVRDGVIFCLSGGGQIWAMVFYTFIAACKSNTAIYIGATDDLAMEMQQHALGVGNAHTNRYRIRKLVYFEEHQTHSAATSRARQLKRWRRAWKDDLINENNPTWSDLMMEVSFL